MILDSLSTLFSDSVLGVLSDRALVTIIPTNTIAKPRMAPYRAAMISKGRSMPFSASDSDDIEIELLAEEPIIDQINSPSMT